MTPSLIALLGYATWTLLLLCGIAALRSGLTLARKRPANSFRPSGDDVSPFSHRLCRAHANCYENLSVAAAIILVAHIAGHHEITDGLAPWLLAARVAQSAVHLLSTSNRAVSVRFGFAVAQVVIQLIWVVSLGTAAL